jgi:hypothetical protein
MYIPFVSDLDALKLRVHSREDQFGNPTAAFVEDVFKNAYGKLAGPCRRIKYEFSSPISRTEKVEYRNRNAVLPYAVHAKFEASGTGIIQSIQRRRKTNAYLN